MMALLLWLVLSLVSAFHPGPIPKSRPRIGGASLLAKQTTSGTGDEEEAKAKSRSSQSRQLELSVFAQMVGEGIAISSLPLHVTKMGASPLEVGLTVSSFSVAQLVCCPLLMELSELYGRLRLLRLCLLGAAVANVGVALSGTPAAVGASRFVAGCFAASVPLAQAAACDRATPDERPRELSRLAATAQAAVVVGPLLCATTFRLLEGLPDALRLRAVFAATALFALAVLASMPAPPAVRVVKDKDEGKDQIGQSSTTRRRHGELPAQALLRLVALVIGWSLTLSVYGYGLFAPHVLGYDQARLSTIISLGALTTIGAQLMFPRVLGLMGEHGAASGGLGLITIGLSGQSILRGPAHIALYLSNRFGSGIANTATATLVARYSTATNLARNLGLVQSTRAAARIVTPPLSGALFARPFICPGALPFLINAACALLVLPIPLLLARYNRSDDDV